MHLPHWIAPHVTVRTPADVVVGVCAVAGALVVLWLALSVLVALVDELRVRRSPRRAVRLTPGVPVVVRRVVALVVGVLLGSSALSAVAAERGAATHLPEAGWAVSAPVEAGWVPTPALAAPSPPSPTPAPVAGPARPTAAGEELVVHRGDSLWSLAQQRCGPGASRADVLAEQERLYAANADVIGADPDVLLPGQVLRLP
ncbi:LysM peptidoglycan-binding domain-containing protein [Kineococcus sp. SYSU DK001]|uniref:LysM peptidoglycan-binding domain-containing protein n=1 Tax=Kineococcus sp. SYSU DK001 TaxID=3383122 RepID=UPI003D7C4D8E